jgi:signal transduction histidine kinase
MDVWVVSRSSELYRLCRDVVGEVAKKQWTVSIVEPDQVPRGAGIYLWDSPHAPGATGCVPDSTIHLFLVGRKELAGFRPPAGISNPNILLKPVTRATLTTFLSQAVTAYKDHQSATASLRAQRDELLQWLIQTNLKLQEYDQDRTSFLARALNDFRAPLTALSGYSGLLLSEPLGPLTRDQREVLQRMLHSTKRVSGMAAAMFQLSIGRHVRQRPDLQSGQIQTCMDQAMLEIAPYAEEKSIAITADLSPSPTELHIDSGQIEQLLANILHNACKFTARTGVIEVHGYSYFWDRRTSESRVKVERRKVARHDANSYRIDIGHSGQPIPIEHLTRIFEETTSYTGGRDRSGGGLGLAICKMIVTDHDGKVWAENTETGTMTSFVLPLRAAAGHDREMSQRNSRELAEAR